MHANITVPTSSFSSPATDPVLYPATPLLPFISDALLSCLSPIVVYWVLSMIFHYIDEYELLEKYRIHTPEEVLKRNHVSRYEVIRDVIIQQVIQFGFGWILGYIEPEEMTGAESWEIYELSQTVGWSTSLLLGLLGIDVGTLSSNVASYLSTQGSMGVFLVNIDWRWKIAETLYWVLFPLLRLGLAIFILDTWQYFWHRLMHQVPFLYRTLHSRHHRLYVPYAFGALYNHPLEGLILDTMGAGLAFKVSGMSMKGSVFFFGFSAMKTVDDHCGYKLPFDPLQIIFSNNAEYHDIHHQGWGIKHNFSQPFLICWDRWLGTIYTGGDAAERNRRTQERVHRQVEAEKSKKASINTPPEQDEYAARRVLPEEDDAEFIKTSIVAKLESTTVTEPPRQRRRTRTITLADVAGKDMAESVKEAGEWVNGVVGNVSGAKVR
ncbi:hypothetical protein TWF569_001828 [Orbilia oligospora]|uniref:Fatty acid hydroxylase domain-containing protein n=1 Tax=Orbilia oligospora TaxID=2813651 RepID=A0A7C8N5R5_ORBOL|nr:hypothetical protein TWF706_002107 [Orbilia oligospora]KAF3084858.1 hypothetical protein TWF102_011806 [Orbilia oligospora]KAF3091626.1 hypothetical protein TWF103_011622 [Orbilia oligospora]KAF3119497.1 hypothetical protein TWF703_003305 [Orbilia oligospora]KAF3123078.1 hypothetical protein TWF569_001828 [Orbilia oligospora]